MLSIPGALFRFKWLIALPSYSLLGGSRLISSSPETVYTEKSKVSSGSSAFSKPSKYSAHLWSLVLSSLIMMTFTSCICEALLENFSNQDVLFLLNLSHVVTGGCRFKFISNLAVPGFLTISQACFCLPVELSVFIAEGWFSCLPLSCEISWFTCDLLNLLSFPMSKMFLLQLCWQLLQSWSTLH